jgi:8-oxo-dGTP diphosphatase
VPTIEGVSTSGDGWTTCGLGHRHWGRFGAAGLLLRSAPGAEGAVGLQLRVDWSHHGGTWGVLGGARNADESPVEAALREAGEEASVDPHQVQLEASYLDDHGGWGYTTVIGSTDGEIALSPRGTESVAVRWVPAEEVASLSLHPGFARSWPLLRPVPASPVLVVDAANVIGSRPDGWWRDRPGAVARLRDQLAAPSDGWSATLLGDGVPAGVRAFPAVVLVVEGAARDVDAVDGVEVVRAPGSGDDALVATVATRVARRPVRVVTADRELRRRVEALGAGVLGPRTLLDHL